MYMQHYYVNRTFNFEIKYNLWFLLWRDNFFKYTALLSVEKTLYLYALHVLCFFLLNPLTFRLDYTGMYAYAKIHICIQTEMAFSAIP